jgi:hypothetical protein
MEGATRLGFVSQDAEDSFGRMADEVIRQMEWARRECHHPNVIKYEGPKYLSTGEWSEARGVTIDGLVPLTLAPEDWRAS